MNITATHINYFHICHRKLWLFSNGIHMEHTSDTVYDGKLLHENSYPQRAEKGKEIELTAVLSEKIQLTGKIDFYDAKEKIIHEIKRSDKIEIAHEWQVKYYIWLLELNGISGVSGKIEYPKLRETTGITLAESDRIYLKLIVLKIPSLVQSEICPPVINAIICRSCSYYELCYVGD